MRGALNRVPGMKRTIGPKRRSDAKPAKRTFRSVDRKKRSSTGQPSSSSIPARISGARNESRSREKRNPAATMTASAVKGRAVGQVQPQLAVLPFDRGSSRAFPDPNGALDRAVAAMASRPLAGRAH